jgi:hypothetical protein
LTNRIRQGGLKKAAFYIDGFNLYYPIKESGRPYLKWSCLKTLGEKLCATYNLELVKVVFCTAVPKHLPDSAARHNKFNAAQAARGVIVLKGHHVPEPDRGGYSEKQSDINVALSLICDGIDDLYDVAFLMSADSDQVATARFFVDRLRPLGKHLIATIPFSKTYPSDYKALGVPGIEITADLIEECVMPVSVQGKTGYPIYRPTEYDPPAGWIHPNDRPKGPSRKKGEAWGPSVELD